MECFVERDPTMYEPYFYCPSDKIWCGFDDEKSVYEKVRKIRLLGPPAR